MSSLLVVLVLALCLSCFHAVSTNPRHCGGGIRHIHLSVGKDTATSMIVTFASIPSKYDPPVAGVLIGSSPDSLDNLYLEELDSPTNYNLTVTHGANFGKNMYYSPHYHHVTITGLQPSTTYYYQPIIKANMQGFGTSLTIWHPEVLTPFDASKALDNLQRAEEEEVDLSEYGHRQLQRWGPYDGSKKHCPEVEKIRSFKTGPEKGHVGAMIAVVGDLGQFPHSEDTMARLLRSRKDIDYTILAGDLAYPGYDHRRWDTFMDFFDDYPLAEHVPLQICPGNHDIDKLERDDKLFLAYENRFRMPRHLPPELGTYDGPSGHLNMDQPPYPLPYEYGNGYYSIQYGGAYVIFLNNYASVDPGSKQYIWFENELKAAKEQRSSTPWLFVVMHTPIYNTFGLHLKDPQIFAAKEHLEPLFIDYQVNVVFTGHIHAYQRTTNVQYDKVTSDGPVHVTVGAGGRQCKAPFRSSTPEEWIEVRDATFYGYGMLTIHNSTTIEWDWIHTGDTDDRDYNQATDTEERLPRGPSIDRVFIQNTYKSD